MYEVLEKNFDKVDIRGFKDKSVWCRNKDCDYSNCKHRESLEESKYASKKNKKVKANVSREVDVALGVYPIKYKLLHRKDLKTVVYVSSDEEIVDSIEMLEDMGVTTHVISWSYDTKIDVAKTLDGKIYLDEIFGAISKPDLKKEGAVPTNVDILQKHEDRFPLPIILAATHRYPDTKHSEECIKFAIALKKVYEQNLH